ncbi:ArnT family glycosyltransferase, partial [Kaarinaea lacus]
MKNIITKLNRLDSKQAWVIAILTQTLFFTGISLIRLVDGDEGYYLMAAKLIAHGQSVYSDFFYPQMPALPYIYAVWFKAFGETWLAGRVLSALFAIFTGLLIFSFLKARIKNNAVPLLVLLLYVCSSLVFGWYAIVKTYSISTFFLLLAIVLFLVRNSRYNSVLVFFCGLSLGLATEIRLFFAGVLPIFLLAIWWESLDIRAKVVKVTWLLVGFLIALIPAFAFFISQPDIFVFNNLGYHSLRTEGGLIGNIGQKFKIIEQLLGSRTFHASIHSFQFLILVVLIWITRRYPRNRENWILLGLSISIFVINLLPTPAFIQYFSVLIPIVLLAISDQLDLLFSNSGKQNINPQDKHYKWISILIILYIITSPIDMIRYTFWGKNVPGVDAAYNWKIETIKEISDWINDNTEPGERVLS